MLVIEISTPANKNIIAKENGKKKRYGDLIKESRQLYPEYSVRLIVLTSGDRGGAKLSLNIQHEREVWKEILIRLLHVTLFLAKRGLAFRGDIAKIGDPSNGNFLGILEVLGKYDPLLNNHLRKARHCQETGKRLQVHYLSAEREGAKYFSLIVNATPDSPYVKQTALLIRYVNFTKSTEEFRQEYWLPTVQLSILPTLVTLSTLVEYKQLRRWEILKEKIDCSLHSTSRTRWSHRFVALQPLSAYLSRMAEALDELLLLNLSAECHGDVNRLKKWPESLQEETKRGRKRKTMANEIDHEDSEDDRVENAVSDVKFKRGVYYIVLDHAIQDITERFEASKELYQNFFVLLGVFHLIGRGN
ncbi:uncharacterized protein LOC117182646 [Belonocnema kinseyi]|uniref:uncharacterized protein LOC117182646 n=1 Tax=Belonocnema kinseyi TaxID=2817044 RepID=UPI00143CD539|nr:uncharacterized protein LOC117182646 [Belonocnema kinseyi]